MEVYGGLIVYAEGLLAARVYRVELHSVKLMLRSFRRGKTGSYPYSHNSSMIYRMGV